jgi:L-rhamnose-H+ transport protein
MNPSPGLGALLVVLGGAIHSSFALPMKRITNWRWENTWLIYSIVGLIVFPTLLALATVPSLGAVYSSTTGTTLALVALFGFGWGLGSTLFGLGIARLGIALGFAIILGITSSLGSLLPVLTLHPEQLGTTQGAWLLGGLAIAVAGIICCAIAGSWRAADLGKAETAPKGSFASGMLLCLASGILSPMLNFAFVYGKPVQDAATLHGAGASLASNAIWAPALAAGFIPNAGYAIYLLFKNRTWSVYGGEKVSPLYWVGAAAMGLIWYGGISIYGMGAAIMGEMGAAIGWPAFMSTVIVVANILGALSGEWKGASARAIRMSWTGIAILVVAILVVSRGL